MNRPYCTRPAGLPKTISEVGVHFFLRLFREKENVGKIFQSHAKWRVSSEMNIERSERRLKRRVKFDTCAVSAEYKLGV